MAESEDKNAETPTPRDLAKAGEPVEAGSSESAVGAGANPQTGQPHEATQDGSGHNEYGQYEEDRQEAEGQSQDSDDDLADAQQEQHENGYDDDRPGKSQNNDEYEDDEDDEDDDDDDYEDEEDEDEDGQRKMTLVEHLDELRTRIIRALIGLGVGMVIALILSQPVLKIIERPFTLAVGKTLIYTEMMVPFNVYMQIALYMGLIIGAPWIFYQIWMFVAAGLYKHERKYVVYAVPFSATLFIAGAMFFLFYVSPMLLKAFNMFNDWMGVEPMVTLDSHVTFMTNMMLVFGFCFQMPIAVLILGKMGLVTVKTLGRFRRHIIVAILILAAVLTGPSPLDQISLAIPMWMLYELGVLLVYFLVEKKRRAEDAAMGYKPIED
jgi:sec-independent protein translocase protein TatC